MKLVADGESEGGFFATALKAGASHAVRMHVWLNGNGVLEVGPAPNSDSKVRLSSFLMGAYGSLRAAEQALYLQVHGMNVARRLLEMFKESVTAGVGSDLFLRHLVICVDRPSEAEVLRREGQYTIFDEIPLAVADGYWTDMREPLDILQLLTRHRTTLQVNLLEMVHRGNGPRDGMQKVGLMSQYGFQPHLVVGKIEGCSEAGNALMPYEQLSVSMLLATNYQRVARVMQHREMATFPHLKPGDDMGTAETRAITTPFPPERKV